MFLRLCPRFFIQLSHHVDILAIDCTQYHASKMLGRQDNHCSYCMNQEKISYPKLDYGKAIKLVIENTE